MKQFIEAITIAPMFTARKMIGASPDMRNRRMYHGSLLDWDTIKKAPHIYLAEEPSLSISLLAYGIEEVGKTITANIYEVEFPDVLVEERYSYTYNGTWTYDVRVDVENLISKNEAVLIAYQLKPGVEHTQCVVMKTSLTRVVDSKQLRITKVREPGQIMEVKDSDIGEHDWLDFYNCFDIREV